MKNQARASSQELTSAPIATTVSVGGILETVPHVCSGSYAEHACQTMAAKEIHPVDAKTVVLYRRTYGLVQGAPDQYATSTQNTARIATLLQHEFFAPHAKTPLPITVAQ